VRFTVEYSSSVLDPHLKKDVVNLEKINHRAARFVMNNYKLQSSVTEMLDKLEWPSPAHLRKNQRLTTMFKITQGLVAVPSSYLTLDQKLAIDQHQQIPAPEQIVSTNLKTFQHLH